MMTPTSPTREAVICLCLPWPPTVNHIYEPAGRAGGRRLSPEAKAYRIRTWAEARSQRVVGRFAASDRIWLKINAFPPEQKRRRDLDNLLKITLDACTKAGIWPDDSQIDELLIARRDPVVAGKIVLVAGKILLGE